MRPCGSVIAAALALVAGGAVPAACSSEPAVETPIADAGVDQRSRDTRPAEDAPDTAPVTGPTLLSQTGLYSDFAARTIAPDLIAFAPRYEFWSDGAKKGRWLYLPPGTKIDTSQIDDFVFPVGTKAFKEFRVGGKLVETRLLMKVREGAGSKVWWQAPYVWKEDGSDAVATLGGVVDALGTTHDVPKQEDCFNCHGDVSDVLLGVSAIQLADPANDQLAGWNAAGRFTVAPPSGIDVPGTGAVKDALGYLHANCGNCHNARAVRLNDQTKMRLRLLVEQKTPEATGAYTTTIGTVMKHTLENDVTQILVKGDPDKSGLWLRMGRSDLYRMPPAGTEMIDDAGRDIVRQWIAGLP
ncbi:MAG: hypothetical protein JST00_06945 [Deltaproteobacteria bacterium]|nr:hypothetical protein [Deltaproteobacteria bacterium]